MGGPSPAELAGARVWFEATIAHGGEQVGPLVVSGGHLVWQADQFPAARVSGLVVPSRVAGVDLTRGQIGAEGHRLRLTGRAERGSKIWDWGLGEYLITKVGTDGAQITIEAADLSQMLVEHQNAVPVGVAPMMRIRDVLLALLGEDWIEFVTPPGDGSPRVPAGFAIGTDRGASTKELLTAWGAVLVPGAAGGLRVVKAPAGVPDSAEVVIRDGDGGSLIDEELVLDRADITNHMIVPVTDSDLVGQAWQARGVFSVEEAGWLSKRIDSNRAIGTLAQAQLVARTELAKAMLRAVTVPVEMVPDYRLEPFTPVLLEQADRPRLGHVTGVEWPLVAGKSMVAHIGVEV